MRSYRSWIVDDGCFSLVGEDLVMTKFSIPWRAAPMISTPFRHWPHGGRQLSWGCHGKYFLWEAKLWGRCDRSTRELVNLDEGQGVYPGSAPLEGGKDLRPASSLLI